MIKLLCLVSCKEEIEYIKKRIQDTIFSSDILPYRQKYGDTNLEVWNIVLDIEERYAKAMEVMFND